MPDRVDATMNAVQSPDAVRLRRRLPRIPQSLQLPRRHNAMLPRRESLERQVPRRTTLSFVNHRLTSEGVAAVRPPAGALAGVRWR